jgi:tryptophan synthase alpha chain
MSRIAQRFAALKAQNRKALIPYFTAGDPDPGSTVDLMHTLVNQDQDHRQ